MSKPTIKPLGNRLLVKRAAVEEKTASGIYLPETAKDKPREGEVLAMGPGKQNEEGKLEPMQVKVGDRILFSSYGGTPVKSSLGEEEFLLMSEDDVLAVLN